ncbi:hypothetical protein F4553_002647 [Allocatelliglobosispora scoriae]|uniref:Aminoglycoside phosphotransferase family protein n=1 Tax=Allocatelliglobosispora scoriae TaxID=643052 RepID=A0A841BPG4_9ACTN|nr:phosphotransferase [Allocatelliglobosispora scoriae]MBB5869268.1 hypothetical protein [Allocatelliglobosispora scoriae]
MLHRPPFSDELRASLGDPRRASRISSSPRSRVWEVEVGGHAAVVKQVVGGAGSFDRYATELTALRLAARATPALVPALLGSDDATQVLVLEHVPAPYQLPEWVPYAEGLARLHAVTGPDDAGVLPPAAQPTGEDIEAFLRLCRALGVAIPAGVPVELAALVERLGDGYAHALLHGDPCIGNVLPVGERAIFIDFEGASLGSGLAELAYLRMGFPTCWQVLPVSDGPLAEAEAAYHRVWRELTGSALPGDLADHCAGWLLRNDALVERAERGQRDQFARLVAKDWTWGPTSARQRLVHRLGAVHAMTRDSHRLGGVGVLADRLRSTMVGRWPGADRLPPATWPLS